MSRESTVIVVVAEASGGSSKGESAVNRSIRRGVMMDDIIFRGEEH